MKKILATLLCTSMIAASLVGCGSSAPAAEAPAADAPAAEAEATGDAASSGKEVINLWAFTDEVPGMVNKFLEAHPDFPYTHLVHLSH